LENNNTIKVAVVDSNRHYNLLLSSGLWNDESEQILLKPNIAIGHPDELRSPRAQSMHNLSLEQSLLEGPLSAQDAYQLISIVHELAERYECVKVILASSGGIGFYLAQSATLGLSPQNISVMRLDVERLGHVFRNHETFLTSIDHLAAFSQERLEFEALTSARSRQNHSRDATVTVTACITHRNRPELLTRALQSLVEQTLVPSEILIIDDGSDAPEAIAALEKISAEPFLIPVTVKRQKQAYLGAARNNGWNTAQSSHVLFLDDDDIAKPNMIECLVRAAELTDAAVVTCFMEYFSDPADLERPEKKPKWLPLGHCESVGCFANLFGSANSLIKKSILEKYNGYVETFGAGHEDWEFYLRICLAGERIELVPDSLFFCRRSEDSSMLKSTSQFRNYQNNLQPVINGLPEWAKGTFIAGFGSITDSEGPVRDMWRLRHKKRVFWRSPKPNPIATN